MTLPPAVDAAEDYDPITLIGRLIRVQQRPTRQRRPWAAATLRRPDGDVRIVVWPVQYKTCHEHVTPGCTVEITGRVDRRDRRPVIIVTAVTPTGGAQR